MFLPATRAELQKLGWNKLDIILVTGDAYIDSPFIGVAVIGKVLAAAGYRVGIIAQPDVRSDADITRLGEPRLFWGISGGSIDSLVANRTASGRKRKRDDYTPGGWNTRRPDRAVLMYANLVRRYFKNTRPLVLGGIEASLRRISHYDYWSNKVRKSILVDAKADYLLYGMAESSVLALADCLEKGVSPGHLRGLCYISPSVPDETVLLPSFAEAAADKNVFARMFMEFYRHNDPITARTLAQQQDTRFLIQNPPWPTLTGKELDRIHDLEFERDLHPFDARQGKVRALETIRFALATHRGCYGECNFCAIAVHQGRTISQRSRQSIVREAKQLTLHPAFKGIIHDVGGPTANMYGFECTKKLSKGVCRKKRCLFPTICPSMPIDHGPQIEMLRAIRGIQGVRKVFVASGIRYDMILADKKNGRRYLEEIVAHHVSGQMKIAPEHCVDSVLDCMGKPGTGELIKFRKLFYALTEKAKLKQFLTYYIIAAHPGCSRKDMQQLKNFALRELKILPRQVQIFTPTPSTFSTLMYWTGNNPLTGRSCFVERSFQGREQQKLVLTGASCRKKTGGKKPPSPTRPRRRRR
ncbi:MAG TPA: YgiQ family radical SAM protein [Desulfobulbus sp.]|nr:YgiQ family radical SAM protein [Desulfobulbus sp.]